MKTLAIALVIISLLAAPRILAQGSQAPFHSQAMFHSQGDEHKSEEGEKHDKEAWDLEELDEEDDLVGTPTPTATPTESPTPTPTPTLAGSPTATPTASPTPTATPEVEGEVHGQSEEHAKGPFNRIADILQQILAYLQSLAPKV